MVRPLAALLAILSIAAVAPAAASAQASQTRGSALAKAPMTVPEGNDCDAYFALGGPVNNPFGATTCSYYQGFVYGNADTDTRTGFVPRDGVVNTVTVRSGPNPAPLRFVILRQLTNALNGAVAGEPKCCFFVRETAPLQPAANTNTTFTVNLPVENNRQPNVITQDAIGFSAATGGTIPIAKEPYFSPATFTFNGVTSSSFHPKLGPEHGTFSGGAFASGHQAGLDILLQYQFTPTGVTFSPGDGTNVLRPTDITTIGGGVLRPIGGGLDVVLNCLQTACAGTVSVLTRNPVAAAKAKKKIRSLGSKKFKLKKGKKRKVRVKLNKLGRKLGKKSSTKITVVVDLGKTGKTTKKLVLKKAKPKKRK